MAKIGRIIGISTIKQAHSNIYWITSCGSFCLFKRIKVCSDDLWITLNLCTQLLKIANFWTGIVRGHMLKLLSFKKKKDYIFWSKVFFFYFFQLILNKYFPNFCSAVISCYSHCFYLFRWFLLRFRRISGDWISIAWLSKGKLQRSSEPWPCLTFLRALGKIRQVNEVNCA